MVVAVPLSEGPLAVIKADNLSFGVNSRGIFKPDVGAAQTVLDKDGTPYYVYMATNQFSNRGSFMFTLEPVQPAWEMTYDRRDRASACPVTGLVQADRVDAYWQKAHSQVFA